MFTGYVANLYRKGANTLTAYEIERAGDRVVLHLVPEV